MYTILNERYLKFELYNGYNYIEGASNEREVTGQTQKVNNESMSRSKFSKSQVVFDLSSFQLQTTDKKWFQGNRIMRNLSELSDDMDSLRREILSQELTSYLSRPNYFIFYTRHDSVVLTPELEKYKLYRDSVARRPHVERSGLANQNTTPSNTSPVRPDTTKVKNEIREGFKGAIDRKRLVDEKLANAKKELPVSPKKLISDATRDSTRLAKMDSISKLAPSRDVLQGAANTARQLKSQLANSNSTIDTYDKELATFEIQWHKILASSFACVAMFLIGAPLGAIIKKGGLGVPFLVSILFFIIYYVLTMQGEKLAKQEAVPPYVGVWMADLILFAVGLVFLRQARVDARLFESDFYAVVLDRITRWFAERRQPKVKLT
jgi:lipopolysaccharide export system permease protein